MSKSKGQMKAKAQMTKQEARDWRLEIGDWDLAMGLLRPSVEGLAMTSGKEVAMTRGIAARVRNIGCFCTEA